MDRLTDRLEPDLAQPRQNVGMFECIEKLADYEDAEEEGRLFELPFRIGQLLFYIYIPTRDIEDFAITALILKENGWFAKVQNIFSNPGNKPTIFTTEIPLNEVDSCGWWFSDRTEAEEAVEEYE